MPPSANPYAAPQSDSADLSRERRSDGGNSKRRYFGWLAVFALNLIVPLSIGWMTTELHGRIGMFFAMLMLLGLGFGICRTAHHIGFALVVGGVAVGLSQVFPILQLMGGTIAFAPANGIGLTERAEFGPPNVDTVVAGFVVTMTTGGLLAAASIVAGLAIRAVLSARHR
jgi:hypothetical protein